MSETSPGNRAALSVGADLNIAALDNPVMLKVIGIFRDLASSCYGPKGCMKVIHNNIGGHVTVTSSCDRLLQSMAFTNPIIKLMVSAVNGHLQQFHDGGLYVIIFATALVKTSLGTSIPRHSLVELNETFLRFGLDILRGKFPCRKRLDFGSAEDPKTLIHSILSTKVGCCLFGNDIEFLTTLIFRAFLSVCPRDNNNTYGTLVYMTVEGLPLTDSALYEGTLIDTPHILPYKAADWKLLGPPTNGVFVALFTMSLTGDAEECVDADYDIEVSVDVTSAMLNNIKRFMDQLIEANVHLICCQCVIHPEIKLYLKNRNVSALDRLGKNNIQHVKQVTGGQFIGSLSQGFDPASLGKLDDVSAVVINKRTYLHLKSKQGQVSTVLLGHRTEEALEELKAACAKCEEVLKISLKDDRVLCGGGCWQTVLISALESKVEDNQESIKSLHDCTSHQLKSALTIFVDSIKTTISALDKNSGHMTDTTNQHHWSITNCNKDCDWSIYPESCECGAVTKTTDTELKFFNEKLETQVTELNFLSANIKILDSFPVVINAFQTAVSVANLVLGIGNIITDKN